MAPHCHERTHRAPFCTPGSAVARLRVWQLVVSWWHQWLFPSCASKVMGVGLSPVRQSQGLSSAEDSVALVWTVEDGTCSSPCLFQV